MSDGPNDGLAAGTVRCPTCRAVQEWSESCRRCKSDLRLLRAFADHYQQNHDACLGAIRCGDAQAAARHAKRCHEIEPGPRSRRLLGLAALLHGDWPTAAELASRDT